MTTPGAASRSGNNPSGIRLSDSAMVPGVTCRLALHAPISAQPTAAELALISGLLPELFEQWLFDTNIDYKE